MMSSSPISPSSEPSLSTGEYSSYLLPGERLEKAFTLGYFSMPFYRVLATDRRVLIIKKFPRNLIDIDYGSIEIVEYYTNVEWLQLLFSLLMWVLAALFYMNRVFVIKGVGDFFPPIAPVLTSGNFFGFNAGSFLLVGAFACVAIYQLGLWALSLFGKLRLIMFDQAPIDVIASFSADTQGIIKLLESRKTASAVSFKESVESNRALGAVSAPKGKKR